jgi:hypothetical protein
MATIEVRDEEDIIRLGTEYALRVLELQKQQAEIKADISALKKDAKLDAVPVSLIDKALNKIKKEQKQSEAEKFEEDAWYGAMSDCEEIVDKIAVIIEI